MSEISPLTIRAYMETDYCVFGESVFVLRAGSANDSLAKLYKRLETDSGAFITAFNPFSNDVSDEANLARQVELELELTLRKLTFFEGVGKHPSGKWAAEPSYFVMGLSLEAAKALGKKYDQNAIVWCGSDTIPELVLLR